MYTSVHTLFICIVLLISLEVEVLTYSGEPEDGAPCVFPFKFLDEWHFTCILDDVSPSNPWCGKTRDFDADGLYGFCRTQSRS